jgi:hypothetical protein
MDGPVSAGSILSPGKANQSAPTPAIGPTPSVSAGSILAFNQLVSPPAHPAGNDFNIDAFRTTGRPQALRGGR